MSNLPRTTTYNEQTVPIYWGTTTAGNTQKPTLTTGKVLAVALFVLAIVQTVALYNMNSQQYLVTQPSTSAISETVKK
jgi:hypothetical protein